MTLIVEDGTGKTDAESYISVADADTYVANYIKSDNTGRVAWDAATTDDKGDALRRATSYLDTEYKAKWQGRRSTELQALDWPRWGVVDCDGYGLGTDEIPVQLKNSEVEMATKALVEELYKDVKSPSGAIKRLKQKVGRLEQDTTYAGAASQKKIFAKVDGMLTCLLEGRGQSGGADRG